MSKKFKYGVYGVGRIGRVHAAIVKEQGHELVALGDDVQAAVELAQEELNEPNVATFNSPADMAAEMVGKMDAMIIASHTKDHARHALPFTQAGIPVYLEKPLTDDLQEAFDFVETIGRDLADGALDEDDLPVLHGFLHNRDVFWTAKTIGPGRANKRPSR